jgi:hypothetical protein
MWKQLIELAKQLFFLTEDTQRNKTELKDLRQEMDALTARVRQLDF